MRERGRASVCVQDELETVLARGTQDEQERVKIKKKRQREREREREREGVSQAHYLSLCPSALCCIFILVTRARTCPKMVKQDKLAEKHVSTVTTSPSNLRFKAHS